MWRVLIVFASILVCACEEKEKKSENKDVQSYANKYYYVDTEFVLHTTRNCYRGFGRGEYQSDKSIISFILREKLERDDYQTYCHSCVSEKDYEEIIETTFEKYIIDE